MRDVDVVLLHHVVQGQQEPLAHEVEIEREYQVGRIVRGDRGLDLDVVARVRVLGYCHVDIRLGLLEPFH
jgi:hypothetical protein